MSAELRALVERHLSCKGDLEDCSVGWAWEGYARGGDCGGAHVNPSHPEEVCPRVLFLRQDPRPCCGLYAKCPWGEGWRSRREAGFCARVPLLMCPRAQTVEEPDGTRVVVGRDVDPTPYLPEYTGGFAEDRDNEREMAVALAAPRMDVAVRPCGVSRLRGVA
ncbi:MAG: hypothetical protein FJ087_07985 [Deltaproteobacteria bacterium]|nr:hypothetical protein [Deltaproteobacteria bacterium]